MLLNWQPLGGYDGEGSMAIGGLGVPIGVVVPSIPVAPPRSPEPGTADKVQAPFSLVSEPILVTAPDRLLPAVLASADRLTTPPVAESVTSSSGAADRVRRVSAAERVSRGEVASPVKRRPVADRMCRE